MDTLARQADSSAVPRLRAFREIWVLQPAEVAFEDDLRLALDRLLGDLDEQEPRP